MAGLQGDSGESKVLAPATSIACDVRASRSAFRSPACCHTRVWVQDQLMGKRVCHRFASRPNLCGLLAYGCAGMLAAFNLQVSFDTLDMEETP